MACSTLMRMAPADNFLYHGKVMVWSAGPDRKIDHHMRRRTSALNKDNILSWQ